MPFPAQTDVRNPDKPAFLRQPHIGPSTYIGVMFADLFAISCKIPTGCAFCPPKGVPAIRGAKK